MAKSRVAPPVPQHCAVPMAITGFRMYCKGCGYEEKYKPAAWHEKAQQLKVAPQHCGTNMNFSRHLKCEGCGYETDQELAWG